MRIDRGCMQLCFAVVACGGVECLDLVSDRSHLLLTAVHGVLGWACSLLGLVLFDSCSWSGCRTARFRSRAVHGFSARW